MPQKSGFFDTTADDPREYPAREFAEYFSRFVGNGIFGGGEKLKVTASGKDMNVSVNLGYGWISGYMYAVYDTPLVLPIEQTTIQDRIDRIVLRLDVSTPVRAIRAIVLQGLPAATPQAPAIVRSGDIYDLSLAQVLVKANTSTVQPHQVIDERLNTQVCGIVTALIDQADTTSIFNEFQSWLKTKTTDYQKQWDDFMKSIQDEGFATTQYVDNALANHKFDASAITSGIIDTGRLRGATTSQFGVCKLYDGVDGGPGGFIAASPTAVKHVYDEMMLVKQSVVDGKGVIAEVINGKGGGPVSANNTFPELAAGINRINTGGLLDFGTAKRIEIPQERAGRDAFDVLTAPANANEVYLNSTSRIVLYNNYGGAQSYSRLSVRNQSGQTHVIVGPTASDDSYFQYFSIAIVSLNKAERRFYIRGGNNKGGNSYELDTTAVPPSDFNLNQNLTFYVEVYKAKTGGASNVMASVSSTKLMYV